jgi:hypothetical protein
MVVSFGLTAILLPFIIHCLQVSCVSKTHQLMKLRLNLELQLELFHACSVAHQL